MSWRVIVFHRLRNLCFPDPSHLDIGSLLKKSSLSIGKSRAQLLTSQRVIRRADFHLMTIDILKQEAKFMVCYFWNKAAL